MRTANTVAIPCSTSILEPRTKIYTSQTRSSQDFYQGLGTPLYFDLRRLYHHPRQIDQSTICASAFGILPLHPYSWRAVKSFQHHRRRTCFIVYYTTPAYKFSSTTMNLLQFLPASHEHHSSARSQFEASTITINLETRYQPIEMCIRYNIEHWLPVSKACPDWERQVKRCLSRPGQNPTARVFNFYECRGQRSALPS
jgi:hypothetical protein